MAVDRSLWQQIESRLTAGQIGSDLFDGARRFAFLAVASATCCLARGGSQGHCVLTVLYRCHCAVLARCHCADDPIASAHSGALQVLQAYLAAFAAHPSRAHLELESALMHPQRGQEFMKVWTTGSFHHSIPCVLVAHCLLLPSRLFVC